MYPGRLNPLQRELLDTWFAKNDQFFLTGGALLVGTTELPRQTRDIDLFTTKPEAFERIDDYVLSTVASLQAESQILREAPEFRRYKILRGHESTLLDLVLDRAPQINAEKPRRDGLVVDPLEEVLVNKICAIVGRGEARDLVDIWYLCEHLELDRERALAEAPLKDGGVDAGSLVYVLRDFPWDEFLPPGVEPDVARATAEFFRKWTEELAIRLFPG